MNIEINNQDEMREFAELIGNVVDNNSVILLDGDLGAGKTFFTSCLANSLEIEEEVTSPTFTIVKEYYGKHHLFHMDAYRLENQQEDVSYLYNYYGNGITVIEWPEFVEQYWPTSYLKIRIRITGEFTRSLQLDFVNCEALKNEVEAWELH